MKPKGNCMKKITTLSLLVATVVLCLAACTSTNTTWGPNQRAPGQTGGSQGAGDLSTLNARGPM